MIIRCANLKKKRVKRVRRAQKTRVRIGMQSLPSLTVHRTLNHIYAQVISAQGGKVLTSASTVEKTIRSDISYGGNVAAAEIVGKQIAAKCLASGIKAVVFDRSGFKYHGRIKALADAARAGGLEF